MEKQNANPTVYSVRRTARSIDSDAEVGPADEESKEAIDSFEVFDHICTIQDPEHPLTLAQLNVVRPEQIIVEDASNHVYIEFTPTVPHCSMSTLIGLCIRVKLIRSLPARFKIHVNIFPGSHSSEHQVNKQLNDKERVAAALENKQLIQVVNKCLKGESPMA